MASLGNYFQLWWQALVHPETAGSVILGEDTPAGFNRFLILSVAAMYAVYGVSMGLFRGFYPAAVSGVKLPFLYLFALAICLPPLYVTNCLVGPRLEVRQVLRLLLMAVSANAAALASYAPFSFFFTLTTSRDGYGFLVLMHVLVFALAGAASIVEIALIFRATAQKVNLRLRPAFLLGWGILYAFVGTQMSWVLRPWIGTWSAPYTPLRPIEGSFIEAVYHLVTNLLL